MCRLAGHDKKLRFMQNVPFKCLKSYSYHIETMHIKSLGIFQLYCEICEEKNAVKCKFLSIDENGGYKQSSF